MTKSELRRCTVQAGKLADEDGIDGGDVSSEVVRRFERALDLEESRLEV